MPKIEDARCLTFDVAADFTLPSFESLFPTGFRVEESPRSWECAYVDTIDMDLHAQHVALCRCVGSNEDAWRLTTGQDEASLHITLPVGDGTEPPPAAQALVSGVSLVRPLVPAAVVRHRRSLHQVVGGDDELVLEVGDDNVRATRAGRPCETAEWRQITLRAGPEHVGLLSGAVAHLESLGANRVQESSELARSLGLATRRKVRRPTGPEVITAYVGQQTRALFAGDVALRHGLNPVHETRVAIRRLRSTLRVFAPYVDATEASRLDTELAWYAGLLGTVRDGEVQRARLSDAVDRLPPELVMGPVSSYINQHLASEQQANRERLLIAMDAERYRALLTTLAGWTTTQPIVRTIDDDEPPALDRQVRKASRQASRRLADALDVRDRDDALHRARKATKRARYAAELVTPLGLARTTAMVKHFTAIQKALGDYQDSVVAAQLLRSLGAAAGTTPGHNGFTYGLLYAQEVQAGEHARTRAAWLLEHTPGQLADD